MFELFFGKRPCKHFARAPGDTPCGAAQWFLKISVSCDFCWRSAIQEYSGYPTVHFPGSLFELCGFGLILPSISAADARKSGDLLVEKLGVCHKPKAKSHGRPEGGAGRLYPRNPGLSKPARPPARTHERNETISRLGPLRARFPPNLRYIYTYIHIQ